MTPLRFSPVRASLGLSLLAAAVCGQSQLLQGQLVLADGEPCPVLPGTTVGNGLLGAGTFAGLLDSPVLDLNGNLFFRARIQGPGVTLNTTDRVLLLGRTRETLQLVLRGGDPDPTGLLGVGTIIGTATGNGIISGSPRISPENRFLMFGVSLTGPNIIETGTTLAGNNASALLLGQPGALTVLAHRGASFTTASNGQTYQFDSTYNPSQQGSSLNSSGTACFQATVIGGDVAGALNNIGWLTGTPGNLDWVIRKNDIVTIAGGNNPGIYAIQQSGLGFNCAMNALGSILHDETLLKAPATPPGAAVVATTANDNCLFVYSGGSNTLLMREGDQADGMAPGVLYGSPTIAQGFGLSGKAGFGCTMTGAVTPADDLALFLGSVGAVQPVMREGDAAPGLPVGVLLGSPNTSTIAYSDYQNGSLAFYQQLTGAGVTAFNDSSVWIGRPGNPLQLIAREGDPAPGFENNVGYVSATFGDTNTGSGGIQAGNLLFNDRGQLVIGGQVTVTVVDGAGTTVLTSCSYSWDSATGLKLLYARNEVLVTTGVHGAQPTFSAGAVQLPAGEGCTLGLNSDGDVALRTGFSNGNGQGAIVRVKLGALDGAPSSISTTLGGVHTMKLDAGLPQAGAIYAVVAGMSGTRPGFVFGGQQIPLNPDAMLTFSINNLNLFPGSPWGTTFGLLDGNGRGTATFTLPPALPALAGIDLDHVMVTLDLGLNVLFVSPPCGVLLN